MKKDCELIGNKGELLIEKYNEMSVPYIYLRCVLDDDLNTEFMYYPLIQASNTQKYLKQLELYLRAVKDNVKFIYTDVKISDKEHGIVIFKHDKYKTNAILYAYFVDNFLRRDSLYGEGQLNPIDYILYKLADFRDEYIKNYYLRRYINHIPPKAVQNEINKLDENENLLQKDRYLKKYELIKKFDNFKDFETKYTEMEKEAKEILEATKKDKDFLKYAKKVKIHPFEFKKKDAIAQNPMFDEVSDEFKNLRKKYLS